MILVNNVVNHFYDLQADMSIQCGETNVVYMVDCTQEFTSMIFVIIK